jgi:capsid protein
MPSPTTAGTLRLVIVTVIVPVVETMKEWDDRPATCKVPEKGSVTLVEGLVVVVVAVVLSALLQPALSTHTSAQRVGRRPVFIFYPSRVNGPNEERDGRRQSTGVIYGGAVRTGGHRRGELSLQPRRRRH